MTSRMSSLEQIVTNAQNAIERAGKVLEQQSLLQEQLRSKKGQVLNLQMQLRKQVSVTRLWKLLFTLTNLLWLILVLVMAGR